jgi:putative MATE family efflux protein
MAILVRDKGFYKTLLVLSTPIVLQNLITFGVGFSDNVMVGKLGEYAIGGVYMGNQIQTLLQMFMLGIAGAMQVLTAQYWGRRDTDSIRSIVAIAFRITLLVTGLISLATILFPARILGLFTADPLVVAEGVRFLRYMGYSYVFFGVSQLLIAAMRSTETVKIGMYVSIVTFVVNLLLNWLLIFGNLGFPALGVMGCAISTLAARIFEAAAILVYVVFFDRKLHLKFRDMLRRDAHLRRDYFRFGLPIIAGQLVWAFNNLAGSAIIGRVGPEAITATSIAGMLYVLVSIWFMGFAAAVGILTGKTVGAGEYEKMKLYAKTIQLIFLGIGFLTGGIVYLLRVPFLSLYAINAATQAVSLQFMVVLAVTIVGTCYQGMALGGLVKAGGDTSFVFINDTIFVFLTVLPSALLAAFVFHAPAWVVFACLKSDQITKCAVAVVKINRFDWMKNLTRTRAIEVETLAEVVPVMD